MTKRRTFGNARKLPSGNYQAGYWWDGRRHVAPKPFPTKTDATAWLAKAEADLAHGVWIAPGAGKVTLAEVAARWLASNPAKRAWTLKGNEGVIRKHINPAIGDRRIDQVTRADVQAVVDGWSTTMAPSSVAGATAVLKAIYNYAVNSELVSRSPAARVRLPRCPSRQPADVQCRRPRQRGQRVGS